MNDFEERIRCGCGQLPWEMPMMDCPAKAYHTPSKLPSTPEHVAQLLRDAGIDPSHFPGPAPEQADVPPMFRDGVPHERIHNANQLVMRLAATYGKEEVDHLEWWLADLHGITEEEHKEGSRWVRDKTLGLPVGPPPPGITKLATQPAIDDRYWQVCEEHDMYATEERIAFVAKVAERAIDNGR